MKRIMIACVAVAAFAAPAFAGSSHRQLKAGDRDTPVPTDPSENSGRLNAQHTGNGAAIGAMVTLTWQWCRQRL